jgi:hypothetical protein
MENIAMTITSQILQALIYILLLVVLILLWRKAFRPSGIRRFWLLLAWAWTMILLGNIAWIVHDLITGTELDTLSVVDLFYVSRYILIAWALWLYPAPLSRRSWFWIGGMILAALVIIWAVYFNPAMTLEGKGWIDFLGMALYPALDLGIITLAWLRFRTPQPSGWSRYSFLLFCAMLSYGIANTINLTAYVFSVVPGGILQNVFWLLTHVFVLVLVLGNDAPNEKQKLNEG